MILYSFLSFAIIGVGASNNFNYNDGARNSPYFYSEIQSLDFDVAYEDDEKASSSNPTIDQARLSSLDNEQSKNHRQLPHDYWLPRYDVSLSEFETDHFEEQGGSPSIVASSVLYDGECYVSSEAMMCNGGGADNMIDRFIYDDLFEDYDEEPSDDDDDDDDNDGHSSMLSTASIRRSKSTTRREHTRCHDGGTSTSKSSNKDQNTYMSKVVRLNNMLQLQHCRARKQNGRRQQQLYQKFTYQPRSESLAFIQERVFAIANDASEAIKRI